MFQGGSGLFPALGVLASIEHELLIFSAFWFAIGLIDEMAIDLSWVWLRLRGRVQTPRLPAGYDARPLTGRSAVLIPAFQEAAVIGTTIAHMLQVWPQRELRLYVGCYRNDLRTISAVIVGIAGDPRARMVIADVDGPTTKADCLNRLYAAMVDDERREHAPFRAIVIHDAEDMVHPAALAAIDQALDAVDFVQLPVRPAVQPWSRWIAGHYMDEFAEAHAKAMVVRSALRAAIPAAGVGCGFARSALAELAATRLRLGEVGPFAPQCLTEDYEMGIQLSRNPRGAAFLRLRDAEGRLVATSSHFPATIASAVRQKSRWVHGIALQSWDRLGWPKRGIELWMALRDRRGPFAALVLAAAYSLLIIAGVLQLARWGGVAIPVQAASPALQLLAALSLFGLIWRMVIRAAFTAREYGPAEGLRAVLRMPVSNIIAIMAGRRALLAYAQTLRGAQPVWEKTTHETHPASIGRKEAPA